MDNREIETIVREILGKMTQTRSAENAALGRMPFVGPAADMQHNRKENPENPADPVPAAGGLVQVTMPRLRPPRGRPLHGRRLHRKL